MRPAPYTHRQMDACPSSRRIATVVERVQGRHGFHWLPSRTQVLYRPDYAAQPSLCRTVCHTSRCYIIRHPTQRLYRHYGEDVATPRLRPLLPRTPESVDRHQDSRHHLLPHHLRKEILKLKSNTNILCHLYLYTLPFISIYFAIYINILCQVYKTTTIQRQSRHRKYCAPLGAKAYLPLCQGASFCAEVQSTESHSIHSSPSSLISIGLNVDFLPSATFLVCCWLAFRLKSVVLAYHFHRKSVVLACIFHRKSVFCNSYITRKLARWTIS